MTALVIGTLRDRVRLEKCERSSDDGGTAILAWSGLGEIYARIDQLSGRESIVADGTSARATHRIVIRHRPDIAPNMRFTVGTRVFDIHAIRPTGGYRRWLECTCEEQLP